jgi:hypothetical protein
VSCRVVEGEGDEIHMHHAGETLGEISKQLVQIAMGGDGFSHLQQGSILLLQGIAGRCERLVHRCRMPLA